MDYDLKDMGLMPHPEANQPGLEIDTRSLPSYDTRQLPSFDTRQLPSFDTITPTSFNAITPTSFDTGSPQSFDTRPPPSFDTRPPPSFDTSNSLDEEVKDENHDDAKKNILGLRVGIFWGVVFTLVLLLAGGIGGGIGIGLASQKTACEVSSEKSQGREEINQGICSTQIIHTVTSTLSFTALPTYTVTASSPFIPPAPISPCTSSSSTANGTTLTPVAFDGNPLSLSLAGRPQTFRILCNTNYPGGASNGNPEVWDMMSLYLPTLEDCVAACAAYNVGVVKRSGKKEELCKAAALVIKGGNSCHFKNATGRVNDTSTSGVGVRIDIAVLL